MILDSQFAFDVAPRLLTVGVADKNSLNTHDAGSAKKLFGGFSPKPPKLQVGYKITAGTGALSVRARLVGATDAVLTGTPEIIADSGVQTLDTDGTALAIGDFVVLTMDLVGQRTAKQHYGVIITQGTADQAGQVTAVIGESVQSNMPGRRAAIPA